MFRKNYKLIAKMKFYTIGYGGRNPDDFLELLRQRGIRVVVDVRLRPDRASMGAYTRARSPERGIQSLLNKAGIKYLPLVELGNVFLGWKDWAERYQELIERAGDLLTRRLMELRKTFCLICAEKYVLDDNGKVNCHRKIIGDYLVQKGYEVEHI